MVTGTLFAPCAPSSVRPVQPAAPDRRVLTRKVVRIGAPCVTIRLERDGPIGRILVDRPDKRNAMNHEMWEQLSTLLGRALIDRAIRVVVVQSATPGMFCAGADITELLAHKDNAAWREANQAAINKAQHDLARFAKPTIAFIDGDCVGGGCGIALACDLRVASASARMGITPAKLGLVYPLHDIKLLIDLVGPGQARKMLYTGELLPVDEAYRIGLIEAIGEDVDPMALMIASNSLYSVHEMKALIRRVLDGQTDDDTATRRIFAEAFSKPDFHEGALAFAAKRKPEFR